MTYPIDESLFAELAALSPAEVCKRVCCSFDAEQKAYILSVWGDEYTVLPEQRRIECRRGDGPGPHTYFSVFLIHHLLRAQETGPVHEWISEKDISGGATFFRGPHEIPTQMISNRYGNDTETFRKRCEQLGGRPLPMADTACSFLITPRTPVAVLYWQGDEDFPPEAKILYDRSLAGYLALDAIYALAVDVCSRLSSG
jgi:hypothetical protein